MLKSDRPVFSKFAFSIFALASCVATPLSSARVVLPNYMTDNMIVQQNSSFTFKGSAKPASTVRVIPGWSDKAFEAKAAKDGSFSIQVPTPPAGGPWAVTVDDGDGAHTLENVLSGEVWLCSGQSNMEMPLEGWGKVMDYVHEIATSQHPDIRLLQVRKKTSLSPCSDVEVNNGGWQICSPASTPEFSAIAYFYARELKEKLGVPVGVIDTTWGGTPAEAWTSQSALHGVPGFEESLKEIVASDYDYDILDRIYQDKIAHWYDSAVSKIDPFDPAKMQSGDGWKTMAAPGYWETSVMPGFDGMVWLQKEIDIPADLAGQPLTLRFAAIDDDDVTYFNGSRIGDGSGYNVPRIYSVPANLVKEGSNVITVRVSDYGGEGGIAPGEAVAVVDGKTFSLEGDWNYCVEKDFSSLPPRPAHPSSSNFPSVLYNAMLYPLKDMPVKGVIWYQGCANVGRAEQYAPLFKTLINDWRALWGKDMPFYFVQLAGFQTPYPVQPDSEWAALRQAQAAALDLPDTGMAVAIDLGNPADIHPKNKQEVAHRLALIAFGRDYGADVTYRAPRLMHSHFDTDAVTLEFDGELIPTSGAITGFIIAGDDGRFTTATPVKIDDTTLRVYAPGVKSPKCVKYDWADYPCGNLYGPTGLPVAPFQTSDHIK